MRCEEFRRRLPRAVFILFFSLLDYGNDQSLDGEIIIHREN